ncbi:hypothetical protein SASPL_133828 [Salvia splendens]|uniref:Uncharacterized protein n=1 Tax=Salvia splendens TaxID=180675 RepID=A0A8X8ZJI0_SALSN|nr:uncharacterized protein LOC121759210 isoform X1 [Salvia splendens]KAG6406229.1 hypothetical protein SASPL_133828 [Salvia splendens]
MASFTQPQFLSSLTPINKNNFTPSLQYKSFPTSKTSKIQSSNAESSQNSEQDPVKLALAKAKSYKNSVKSGVPAPKIVQAPEIGEEKDNFKQIEDGNVEMDVPLAVDNAKQYQQSKNLVENEKVASDAESGGDSVGGKEIPLSVKLALEKAKEYKKKTGDDNGGVADSQNLVSGLKRGDGRSGGDKNSGKKDELKVSSTDFMGLGFADKKSGRGLPAGLIPLSDPFPGGKLPEVEIIVGDTSKFGDKSVPQVEENDVDLYKPKVSTWGVFPRPNNISKTFGGGRTLRPGDALETAEERAAKDERTMQLLAAYKRQYGLNIDPELKSECEKALKDGDSLMDLGKLKEASPFYERVMEKLPFKSELHGLAALQWSICQDSLNRSNEARLMYEKLQSHPSPKISKKARQFAFGFEAMEMMKVSSMARPSHSSGYQSYFNAFIQQKTNYPLKEAEVDEGGFNQAIPYFIFLASPILMVLLIAAYK